MKKEYIKPEMQVYEMETLRLMAASPDDPPLNFGGFPEEDDEGML